MDARTTTGDEPRPGRGNAAPRPGSMRVLVVSWYMPPRTTMGSLRVGKLCKYLVG
jgi:hypothetical protein